MQHELARLERLEIVTARRRGRQKFYTANKDHPLFPDLRRIVYKTAGLGDALRETVGAVKGIRAAFIYGSVAKGTEGGRSDVDLMVVGASDSDELHRALRQAEEILGREVTVTTMTPTEWAERAQRKDAFVQELQKSPKIYVVGDERALAEA